MKMGLQINRFTWPGEPQSISPTLTTIAKTAEQGGFYSIWVMDHFFQIRVVGEPEEPMMEAYTTLGFLASVTNRVKLGAMVTGVIYRYPGLLVNAVTTLDVLSEGRAYLGVGAAWNEEESRALGFPFPPVSERFERLEEVLQIILQMWKRDTTPFHGKHYQLEYPYNSPMPISKPHPPVLIGGGGEQKTLKLVAKYADACNLFDVPGLEHKLDILKQHCKDIGRDYDTIEKTVMCRMMFTGDQIDADAFIKECQRLKSLGFDQVITSFPHNENIELLETICTQIVPHVSTL